MNRTPRILVVAQEPQWVAFVAEVLKRHEYRVHFAQSVTEALGEIKNHPFDLIIIDALRMELLRNLALGPESYRLLVVSTHTTVPEALEAYRLGAMDYVNKAFGESSLLNTVAGILAKQPVRQRFLV